MLRQVQGLQQVRPLGPRLQNQLYYELCLVFVNLYCLVKTEVDGKKVSPVTLSSVVLGPAFINEENPVKDLSLPHLKFMVQQEKDSGRKGYYSYSALVESGATYNCISWVIEDRLSLEVIRKRKLLPITTINGEFLLSIAVVCQVVCMRDSAKT